MMNDWRRIADVTENLLNLLSVFSATMAVFSRWRRKCQGTEGKRERFWKIGDRHEYPTAPSEESVEEVNQCGLNYFLEFAWNR